MAKIDSVFDFTGKGLVELKSWLEPWFPPQRIDSTENQGLRDGVHSEDPVTGPEPLGYVLTTTGVGGSVWGPMSSGGGFTTYRDCRMSEPSIVHFWPCDEASGNLVDIVGANDLTPTTNGGFPQYAAAGPFTALPAQTAVVGGSGANQGRFEGFPSTFGTTLPYTIEFWAYPTSAANGAVYHMWDGTIGQLIQVGITGGGTLWYFNRGAVSAQGGTITLNAWTLITATFTGSAIFLYQDGVQVATTATSTSLTAQTTGAFLNLRNTSGGGYQPFTGRVCLLGIYDTALTTFCNLSPSGGSDALEGSVLAADGAGSTGFTVLITVQTGAPSTYQTPLVFDDTVVTGGLYGWDGTAYQQIGGPI